MKHGSLFSGIGGFDLASEWMGWENVFHCEWMEFPRKVLDYYWPNADSHIDICKTDFKKYEGTIDIISGGFPCQPFSMAGKRKGTEDERYLWGEMLRAVQEIKPKFVIAENVFGITNIDGGLVFEQVCLDLEAEGYEVQPFIIPAASKNAPHRRDRVWFIATNTVSNANGLRTKRGLAMDGEVLERRKREETSNRFNNNGKDGDATDTDGDGFIKGRRYDGIGKNVDGGNTSVKWSTNSKDIDGCGADGVLEEQSRIDSRVSQQTNVEENKIATSRGICGVDKTNECKGTIRKNWIIIDKSRALVQERQSRVFASINRGLGNNKTSFGELANMGFSIDLSRINPMDWNATNTSGSGFQAFDNEKPIVGQKSGTKTFSRNSIESIHTRKINWQNFPTQSPICSGDDGLPTELDGITFSKWRAESIKGYGNAIVPQVAYELFQVIEKINCDL